MTFKVTLTLSNGDVATFSVESFTVHDVDVKSSATEQDVKDAIVHSYTHDEYYTTTEYRCSCPDYSFRKLGTNQPCKHQLDQFGGSSVLMPAYVDSDRKIQAIKDLKYNNEGMTLTEAKDHIMAFIKRQDS